MKKDIKALWLAALRSGKYKQGREVMYNPEKREYCCLGVLCRVLKKDPLAETNNASPVGVASESWHGSLYSSSAVNQLLSKGTLKKTGMRYKTMHFLAELNDKKLNNFKQIAAYISRNL